MVTSCVGCLALVILVLYESIWVAHPMFNLAIFDSLSTVMLYVGSLLHGLLVSYPRACLKWLLTAEMQIVYHLQNLSMYIFLARHFPSILTGLSLLAMTGPILPILLLTARLGTRRYPFRTRWIIRAGWALNLIASGCFILLDANTPTPGWISIFFATGVSHALLLSGYHTSSHLESPVRKWENRDDRQQSRSRGRGASTAFAIVMYSILRTWGMCIAVPVSGAIVFTQMAQEGNRNGSSSGLESLVQQNGVMTTGRDKEEEMGRLFLDGFKIVWRFFMGASALGGISSLLVR